MESTLGEETTVQGIDLVVVYPRRRHHGRRRRQDKDIVVSPQSGTRCLSQVEKIYFIEYPANRYPATGKFINLQ
jgi:hypothetical protein